MTALELHLERASSFEVATERWGDDLDRLRYRHDHEIAHLELHGAGPGAVALLDRASDELWTAAAFVHLVARRVSGADRHLGPTPILVGELLAGAERLVAAAAGRRDRATRAHWMLTADPAELRAVLEARSDSSSPHEVLGALTPTEAVAYWSALTGAERDRLVEHHPELVVLRVLAHGGRTVLDPAQLRALVDHTEFATLTTSYHASAELSVGVRVIDLVIGTDLRVITRRLDHGGVEMLLIATADAGVAGGIDVPHAADATAGAGLHGRVEQRLEFADVTAADDALAVLRRAAAEDASFPQLVRMLGAGVWNTALAASRLTNPVTWFVQPPLPTIDLRSETLDAVDDLWRTNGTARLAGGGVRGEVAADVEVEFGLVGGELRSAAEVEGTVYDSDRGVRGDADDARTGIMWSGAATVEAQGHVASLPTATVGDPNGRADAELSFVLDMSRHDDGAVFVELLLSGAGAAGAAVELADGAAADLGVDGAELSTMAATVVVTTPVTEATAPLIGLVGTGLLGGRVPVAPLRELGRSSTIEITATRGTEHTADGELDAGVATASATATVASATTVVALHRRPGGSLYSRQQVAEILHDLDEPETGDATVGADANGGASR